MAKFGVIYYGSKSSNGVEMGRRTEVFPSRYEAKSAAVSDLANNPTWEADIYKLSKDGQFLRMDEKYGKYHNLIETVLGPNHPERLHLNKMGFKDF